MHQKAFLVVIKTALLINFMRFAVEQYLGRPDPG
jgi:hypothetical protein